jgi:polyphosphate kinase
MRLISTHSLPLEAGNHTVQPLVHYRMEMPLDNAETAEVPVVRMPYMNRELSWLDFNARVLDEAFDTRHPLLERVKFLAIFGSNLDEFFMIRVSALQAQRSAGMVDRGADGLTAAEALEKIATKTAALVDRGQQCRRQLINELASKGIRVMNVASLTEKEQATLSSYFDDHIYPILTPLAVDPGHPFPHISSLSLNLAVTLDDDGMERFARVKVPATLPRLLPVGDRVAPTYVWLEDVVARHIGRLFPGYVATGAYPFRVTRDADVEIREAEAEDLMQAVTADIERRHFSFVTRLEVSSDMPRHIRELLVQGLEMDARNVAVSSETGAGVLGVSAYMELVGLPYPELKDAPHVPRIPDLFTSGEDIFSLVSREDILLHHPYDSFNPVIQYVQEAARDQDVLAIKQALYRVGTKSPIVQALMEARDVDTQVAVLVELKARFDEQNNITWARRLDEAGVHVAYGLIGLKTHAKILLIVRRNPDGSIRRFVHLGTGNYNATTARIYTDFGLMSADPDLGADVSDLFNVLTGYSKQKTFRKLLVAPLNLRERLVEMIRREAHHARKGRTARIIFQMNALVDEEMIRELYDASRHGVQIDLIVRGICCLVPGLEGLSENIRVISIVGRFLEHARIYYFHNHGDTQLWMGSADLMTRNLDRRVEVVFPVELARHKQYVVEQVLLTMLSDTAQARQLTPDGEWERLRPGPRKRRVDSQQLFVAGKKRRRNVAREGA